MAKKKMTQLMAIIIALQRRGFLLGDHENARADSEQGRFIGGIYGEPIKNNSLTAAFATLRMRKIVTTVGDKWILTENWEEELRKYDEDKKRAENKNVTSLLKELVGSKEEMEESHKVLEEIGDDICPYSSSADKRDAGCRRRAEVMHGARAMFTGETEPRAWQASHSIEVRASRTLVDNSPYNILMLRSDIHAMRDGPNSDGIYPMEIHACGGDGLRLVVKTLDPLYFELDGVIQRLGPDIARDVQKRVIIGNIARGICQDIPEWFSTWQDSVMQSKHRPRARSASYASI